MSKLIVYTFRTNPFKTVMQENGKDIFIFGSLKKDLESFKEYLLKEKPNCILGVATTKGKTQIETRAINAFGKRKLSKTNEGFDLTIPRSTIFPSATQPTTSFCNWTMFKIAEYISSKNLPIKLSFIHFNPKDIQLMINFLQMYDKK